jgi:hypothetical protein
MKFQEFEPTAEQIADACAEIQRGWSPAERRSRATGSVSLTKFRSDGVKQAARVELDHSLAMKRQKLREAKA